MMNDTTVLARQLRLAVVTNVFKQGLLDEGAAKELLAGPLVPGDDSTIYDDSALLGDCSGLEKITNSIPSPEPRDKPFKPFLSLTQADQDWIDSQDWDTSPPPPETVADGHGR